MAQIYQPQGQQVNLTGPGTEGGFRPVQAFDPTGQIAAAQNRQLSQFETAGKTSLDAYSSDLRSLTEFSSTLNKMVVDEGKIRMENQINLGIADVLNGELAPTPEAKTTFKQKEAILDGTAAANIQTSNEIAKTDVPLAETVVVSSPAVNQWREKGRSIGKAQAAAGNATNFFRDWLKSDVPSIPIPDGKGGTTLIAPSQVRTGPEMNAAWSVGMQQFIQQSNIRNINPTILAEHLTPQILRVKGALLAERMDEIRRLRIDNDTEQLTIRIGVAAKGMSDPVQTQQIWNTYFKEAVVLNGGNRKDANTLVATALINNIRLTAQSNSQLATTMLTNLGSTLLNPDDPSLGTLAQRFPNEFAAVSNDVKGVKREEAIAKKEADDAVVANIENTYNVAAETSNLATSRTAFAAAEKALTEIGSASAIDALQRIRAKGRNYNAITNKRFAEAIESGIITTKAEADEYLAAGLITKETHSEYSSKLLTDKSSEQVTTLKPALMEFAFTTINAGLKGQGTDYNMIRSKLMPIMIPAVQIALEKGKKLAREAAASGKEITSENLQGYLQKEIQSLVGPGGRLNISTGAKGQLIYPTLGKGVVMTNDLPKGPKGTDYSNSLLNRLPQVTSARLDKLPEDRIVSAIEIISNGGTPPPDIVSFAQSAGVSVDALLQQQAPKWGLTYVTPAKAKQTYDANYALNPRAAGILISPRATPDQRIQATMDLRNAKRAQEQQQQYQQGVEIPVGKGSKQQALKQAAEQLGIKPIDLAAVMSLETGGTFNPDIVGGAGNAYRGLIQFGPNEQRTYGWAKGMGFEQQVLGPVVRYLKARGVKPGATAKEIYAAILTGNVANITKGGLDWKDFNGTSVSGALPSLTTGGHYKNALRFLGKD